MPSGRIIEPRAQIVAHLLGAKLIPWDRNGRQGAYDWHLLLPPNDELAALEVTSHADRDLIELSAAMDRLGDEIPAPTLRHHWKLGLADDVYRQSKGYRTIRRAVETIGPDVLANLEARGVFDFERPEYGPATADIEPLAGLGIAFGMHNREPAPEGSITLWPPENLGPPDTTRVLKAAMVALAANRAKLGCATTRQRHLLVWIDSSDMLTWMAFDGHRPPAQIPRLGPEVTTLWVAGRHRDQQASVVWRVGPEPRWETCLAADTDLREPASPASG